MKSYYNPESCKSCKYYEKCELIGYDMDWYDEKTEIHPDCPIKSLDLFINYCKLFNWPAIGKELSFTNHETNILIEEL